MKIVMPLIAVIVVIAAFSGEAYVMTHSIPAGDDMLVGRVLGTFDAGLMTVINYFFGSSAGSARKNEMLAQTRADKS